MTLPIVFRRPARADFDDAADWYEQRRAGPGAAFTAAVQRVLDQIAAQPDFCPQVYQDVQEALVPGYVLRLLPRGTKPGRGSVGLSHGERSVYVAGSDLMKRRAR
jgi:plasmid stabilization system protein ParE